MENCLLVPFEVSLNGKRQSGAILDIWDEPAVYMVFEKDVAIALENWMRGEERRQRREKSRCNNGNS